MLVAPLPPFERILNKYIFNWHYGGFWPLATDRSWYKPYSICMRFILLGLFPFGMYLAMPYSETMEEFAEAFMSSVVTIMGSLKMVCLVRNRRHILRLLGIMARLDAPDALMGGNAIDERRHLDAVVRSAKRLMYGTSYIAAIGLTIDMLGKLFFSDQPVLILPSVYPWNWRDTYVAFVITLQLQYVCTIAYALVFVLTDTYGPAAFMLLSAYLDMLGQRMRRLGYTSDSERSQLICERQLTKCIEYYALCLECADCLSDIFALHYTQLFCGSGLYVCLTILQLISAPGASRMFYLFMHFTLAATQVFLPCFFGSLVAEKSDKISEHVYACNWMDQSERFKSSMRIVVERAQRPIVLQTYKGLFLITLPTFVTLMKFAYTLIGVVNTIES